MSIRVHAKPKDYIPLFPNKVLKSFEITRGRDFFGFLDMHHPRQEAVGKVEIFFWVVFPEKNTTWFLMGSTVVNAVPAKGASALLAPLCLAASVEGVQGVSPIRTNLTNLWKSNDD